MTGASRAVTATTSRYADLYVSETRETLAAATRALLALERAPSSRVHVDELFRALHTVKGMAAAMGDDPVARLAHEAEGALDSVRAGVRTTTPALVDAMLAVRDALEAAIESPESDEAATGIADAHARLRGATSAASGAARVEIRLERDTPLKSVRALLVLRAVRAAFAIASVEPAEASLSADAFDGVFTIVLEHADDDAEIARLVRSAGFVDSVAIVRDGAQRNTPQPASLDTTTARPTSETRAARHVRVALTRLDSLTDLVGELVVARGRLATIAERVEDPVLDDALGDAGRLIGELQDGIMRSRMVPVWQVFERFPRVVRDTARTLGKDVELHVGGQEIELDRSMLDELGEPLVHLLRNAVDHGIESPEEREALGKARVGRVTLAASRERSSVVVRVEDDGRGIDRARVLERAREAGLVDATRRSIADEELTRLLARPGFTTAERVTSVSGRGVGIDAVLARVRSLGGTLEIKSTPGTGTTITIRVPASLAIVRSVLVLVGGETYALPVAHVSETLRATRETVKDAGGHEVFVLRDTLVPVAHLRTIVGLPPRDVEGLRVVVLEVGERRLALVVDALVGQEDVVVKPFDPVRGASTLFGGATILGDGRPALILDIGTLL